MTQTEQFEADVAGVESEGLVLCKHQGKEFRGQRTPVRNATAMVEDGFELALDFMLAARSSQWTGDLTPPSIADVIEMDGVNYDVKTVEPDQFGVVINYGLKQST